MTNLHDFWIWVTGFYEGEGSCGCYYDKRKRNWKLHTSIAQKDRRVLWLIKRTLKRGSITKAKGSWGNVYQWRMTSAEARWFLKAILPLMHAPKKIEQTRKALKTDKKYVGPRHTRRDPVTGRLIRRK
jgi:hypothetical protein